MKALWQISISASPETEDALAKLLLETTGQRPSVFTNMETDKITVSVHLEKLSQSARTLESAIIDSIRSSLAVETPTVTVKKLSPQNWAESWKRHFKPLSIGGALLIKPSWSKRRPRAGQFVVVLDPGLSFGTGQHATTSFCLHKLASFRQPQTRQSLLDIGSGSGILAISAAKLGYRPVDAFDFDPQAVRVSRDNARSNQVRISFHQKDLTKEPLRPERQYDIVCANLIYDILISQARKISKRLKPGGRLVLAGILSTQFASVHEAFAAQDMRLVSTHTEKEWQSGEFDLQDQNKNRHVCQIKAKTVSSATHHHSRRIP